jgi:predicted dehydrogenase
MSASGMNYAPQGRPEPVVGPGEFAFAAMHLDHGHINGMCQGLSDAGAELRWIYDPDQAKVKALQGRFPAARVARSADEVLADSDVRLVAAAAIPNQRGPLGLRVMAAGKDYFTDKTPFTSLGQLEDARRAAAETGRKYMVYYSERLHNESAVYADELIAQGAIGKIVQVLGLGPHRLNAPTRPAWFFKREQYGGILCDIGSHQVEQLLFYSGAADAEVRMAAAANRCNPDYPELEDFGEASLLTDTGCSGYFRVDWLTPAGLGTWGDGRTLIVGSEGYIELRKYIDVARDPQGNQLYLVNAEGERHMALSGQVGFPFFGRLIRDCIERGETAMTQAHAFKAAELCLKAQALSDAARR